MSDIFVKAATSGGQGTTGWRKASRIWAKTDNSPSTGWREATGVWIRNATQWLKVWPISGIFASRVPYISTSDAGTYADRLTTAGRIRMGYAYYGDNAVWDLNGFAASNYTYQWKLYDQYGSELTTVLKSGTGSGWTSSAGEDALLSSIWTTTNCANSDEQYLGFECMANASNGSVYSGRSVSSKIKVIRQSPVNSTYSLSSLTPVVNTQLTYSSTWLAAEANRARTTTIGWYRNSTNSTTGGTPLTTGSTYTPVSADVGKYIYVTETRVNSGSDFDYGVDVGVSVSVITSSAVTAAIAAPTISSITASSIGGPVSVSFTGGSGPFYQIFWWGTATAPTGLTTADASGTSSPLTDNTGPTSTATNYMYVRSTSTQFESGTGPSSGASAWSAGVSFNMTSASALTPTFGANTSTTNGFTGSVTNYNSAYNWNTPSNGSFTLTNGTWTWGTASGATRPFTVTGLSASQSSTATVTTTRSDYASGSDSTTGTALAAPQYTVTWDAAGGEAGTQFTTQNAGVSHTAPSPGPRDGFDLLYYRSGSGTGADFVASGGTYTPTASVTFNAIWTAKTYTVSYNANLGTGAPSNQTKTHGVTLTLSSTSPTRATVGSASYAFNGWNTASDGTGTNYSAGASYTLNAALSLFAQWTVTTLNWSISWNANGGTGGGTTTQPRGNSHTAPSPGTRSGFTFSQWRKPEFGGDPTFVANNGTFTPTAADAFWAQWTANTVTPTITIAANSGVSATAGTINWTSTNQASFSSTGTFSATGTTGTSISKTGLTASTNYTGTVTVTSSTGHTASANYSLTTSGAPFVAPTCGPPQISNNQLGFVRSGTSVTWYSDYPTPQGNYSYIIGMEWQVRTTNSTTTTPLNTGTYAGGGSGDGLQGNTTKYMTYPVSTTYPYSAAGTVWAFRIKSTENTAATSSSRFARARVIMMGTNGTVYFGTWSTNI